MKVASRSDRPSGPIQFWVRRNSPGSFVAPRPVLSSSAWISRMSRSDRGSSDSLSSP